MTIQDTAETTIKRFGKFPHLIVMLIAGIFGAAPSMLAYYKFPNSSFFSAFAAFLPIWIPFCCLTVPLIYYLCREILSLRKRVEDLEKKSNA